MYQIDNRLYKNEIFAMNSENLRLSVLKKSAVKEVTDYTIRNKEFHKKWAQTHDDNYFTCEIQKKYLKHDAMEFERGRLVPLWITKADEPDRIIGRVSFFNFAYGGMMSCSIGYHIDKDEQGKGYMTEAITAACEMIIKEMKMHRIEAFILPDNERSLALINRCGFTEEGMRYSYMHINGKWSDHKAFYILEDFFRNIT